MTLLRTTPDRYDERDVEVFPAFAHTWHQCRYPHTFAISQGQHYVLFMIGGFYVPGEIEERLRAVYAQYAHWWVHDSGLPWPRNVILRSTFHNYAGIAVHNDHAQWWVDLFNEAAQFIGTPWGRWDP
jgi:hypothetical protein